MRNALLMSRSNLFFTLLFLFAFGIPSKGSRPFRRQKSILIDENNVADLQSLLYSASPGANVQLKVESMTLSESLYFNVSNITFGAGLATERPIIRCDSNRSTEIRIVIDASRVHLRNLVIEGCSGPALRVMNSNVVKHASPPHEAHVFTVSNVTFFNNTQSTNTLVPSLDGGAMQITAGTVATVRNCEFRQNFGVVGGAIRVLGSASLRVFDSVFIENTARLAGAGIYGRAASRFSTINPSLHVTRCTFTGNEGLSGQSDPTALSLPNGAALEVNAVLRIPNPQPAVGGIYAAGFDRVVIAECVFRNNTAATAGGAVFIADNKQVAIRANLFFDNSATGTSDNITRPDLAQGGALYVAFSSDESEIEIEDCTFRKNQASYGGAIHLVGTLTTRALITNCSIDKNIALLGGGGLIVRNIIQVVLENVQFHRNSARLGGGLLVTNGAGIFFSQGIDESRSIVFSENEAMDGAGCCLLVAGTSQGQAVTFERNYASRHGGGLAMIEGAIGATITIQDSTFTNNSARLGGGVYHSSTSTFLMLSTWRGESILSRNRALAGGAMFLQPWNQVRNDVRITRTVISDNEAVLSNEELFPLVRPLPEVDLSRVRDSALFEDNQAQNFACGPGGGGGVCISLSPLLPRASLGLELRRTRITQNKALNGGGVLISSSEATNCTDTCPIEGGSIKTTTSLCSGVELIKPDFSENEASGSGSTLLLVQDGAMQWTCPTA